MKTLFAISLLLTATIAHAAITVSPGGGGGSNIVVSATNAIPFLNGNGTNTSLYNVDIVGGNGRGLTNVLTSRVRFIDTGNGQDVFNTNIFYLEERTPRSLTDHPIALYLTILGIYKWDASSGRYYTPTNDPSSPAAVIYATNSTTWVLNDISDGIEIYWLTNNGAPSVFPWGPWYPDTATINASLLLANQTNVLIANAPYKGIIESAQTSLRSTITENSTRSAALGSKPITLVTLYDSGVNANMLTNAVDYITDNNLVGEVDVLEIDRWTASRNAGGDQIFNSTDFPNLTLSSYAGYLHSVGLKAGVHEDAGVFDPNNGVTGSYPYYHRDATNILANAIDLVLLDSTEAFSIDNRNSGDLYAAFVKEFRDAQITYNHPLFIHGAVNGGFDSFENWMVSCDTWYFAADSGGDDDYLMVIDQSAGWIGNGKYPILANPDSTFTGSVEGARRYWGLAAITPAHAQLLNTNSLNSDMVGVMTNSDFKNIWRDAAGNSGWLVSSNATGEVRARRLDNGDLAIYFMNLTAGPGTLTVNWVDLKISTNQTLICRDVFEGTNDSRSISLSRALAANEGSLWRIYHLTDTNAFDSNFANYVSSIAGTGSATNAIANTNGVGTNTTFYGTTTFTGSSDTNSLLSVFGTITISNSVSAKPVLSIDTAGSVTANLSGSTNLPASGISFTGFDTSPFTNLIAARIPVFTNSSVVYYLVLSTNAP